MTHFFEGPSSGSGSELSDYFEISNPESQCCGRENIDCRGTKKYFDAARSERLTNRVHITREAYCLLRQLMISDPKERITARNATHHIAFKNTFNNDLRRKRSERPRMNQVPN